jgi:transcriptional regulator with XRE-family HTH domain
MFLAKEYMSPDKTEKFIQWLDEQEQNRGWSDYRLAKEAGVNPSVLSKARSGVIPKWDACIAIAQALRVSPITVFRAAGLLPEGGDEASFTDYQYLLSQLTTEEQEEIRQIMEMKIERRQKAEQSARSAKFKPGKVNK